MVPQLKQGISVQLDRRSLYLRETGYEINHVTQVQ